jgi:hypothetical protein
MESKFILIFVLIHIIYFVTRIIGDIRENKKGE